MTRRNKSACGSDDSRDASPDASESDVRAVLFVIAPPADCRMGCWWSDKEEKTRDDSTASVGERKARKPRTALESRKESRILDDERHYYRRSGADNGSSEIPRSQSSTQPPRALQKGARRNLKNLIEKWRMAIW